MSEHLYTLFVQEQFNKYNVLAQNKNILRTIRASATASKLRTNLLKRPSVCSIITNNQNNIWNKHDMSRQHWKKFQFVEYLISINMFLRIKVSLKIYIWIKNKKTKEGFESQKRLKIRTIEPQVGIYWFLHLKVYWSGSRLTSLDYHNRVQFKFKCLL